MARSALDERKTTDGRSSPPPRLSRDSLSSISTTSLVFDRLQEQEEMEKNPEGHTTSSRWRSGQRSKTGPGSSEEEDESESGPFLGDEETDTPRRHPRRPMDRKLRRVLWIVGTLVAAGWLLAFGTFVFSGSYKHASDSDHNPDADSRGSGKSITLDQVFGGFWSPHIQPISWIADPDGDDGLLLEKGAPGKDYLMVEDVRSNKGDAEEDSVGGKLAKTRTLMKSPMFQYNGQVYTPEWLEPSADLKKVLLGINRDSVWRHSFTATYFVLDVASGQVEPLVPDNADAVVQLATWSPSSDAVSFTMDNNVYIRKLVSESTSPSVVQITKDGGPEYFYGIPDWVYEEEVLSGATATWWSLDGKFLAFLRTNETGVPDFAIDYYIDRPTGKTPPPGEEAYPDVVNIKYPKPGSHNPVVDVQYYDVAKAQVFSVPVQGELPDDDRIITNVLWAGAQQVLVKQSNRVGDFLKVILVDVTARSGKIVNNVDVKAIDGGWFEIEHGMTYVPADPSNGRPHAGYVDTVIHEGYEHLGYFSPLNNSEPVMLTSGAWEVVDGPAAVDPANNIVYFVATKESSIQRHVYSVKLDGTGLKPLTDTSSEGYHGVSFSSGAGFALVTYLGPKVPYQKLISTPSNSIRYDRVVSDNAELADKAKKHELPVLKFGELELDTGATVNYLERRPPHFNSKQKHGVLFQQYSGPGSQSVTKRFVVDFQSYVASTLGYVVVTVDPRGTGFRGRQHRVGVRSQLGVLEAQDHIAAAKHWASLPYVDETRLAMWGWSYGGFQTLKTLEADAGNTFSYGMAVAPVTDWRFYDSIYTERYMRLPSDNEDGYEASRIANASALGQSKRFLVMHGASDDNVHFQNTLKLIDELDLEGVENYDVHVFPDSDHSISFHGANRVVYDSECSLPPTNNGYNAAAKVCLLILYRTRQLAGQRVQRRVAQDCESEACGRIEMMGQSTALWCTFITIQRPCTGDFMQRCNLHMRNYNILEI